MGPIDAHKAIKIMAEAGANQYWGDVYDPEAEKREGMTREDWQEGREDLIRSLSDTLADGLSALEEEGLIELDWEASDAGRSDANG